MDKKEVSAGSPAVKHPPPWKWTKTANGYELVDGNGGYPIGFAGDEINDFPPAVSPLVLELIRLAPEMEAALRGIEWAGTLPDTAGGGSCCPECEADADPYPHTEEPQSHCDGCSSGGILSALDAARKATP